MLVHSNITSVIRVCATQLKAEPLLGVCGDDDQRFPGLSARIFTFGLRRLSQLWLDNFNPFRFKSLWLDNIFYLHQIPRFAQNFAPFCNRALWLAAYPEGTVGDADSSPGDGQGVFERRGWCVGASIQPITFTPDLHLHRKSLCILTDGRKRKLLRSPKAKYFSSDAFIVSVSFDHKKVFLYFTWAMIIRGPFPAAFASTVNSAGWLTRQPVFSSPGPEAWTYKDKTSTCVRGVTGQSGPIQAHFSVWPDAVRFSQTCVISGVQGINRCSSKKKKSPTLPD